MTESLSWVETFVKDEGNRLLFEESALITEVTEVICEAIERAGVSRSQVAERMGRTPPFVSQLLAGDRNMQLRSVAGLAFAAGVRLRVIAEPLGLQGFSETDFYTVEPRPFPRIPIEPKRDADLRVPLQEPLTALAA